jgi:hypothetical protein
MSAGTILMRRLAGGLFPLDAKAAALIHKLPQRTPVAVRIDRRRSAVQNAMYWSVLEHVVAATGRWRTPEELHIALKVATGHVDPVRLIDGRMILVPQSIGFDHMSQDEAQAYYDAAFRVICDEVMGGMEPTDLLTQSEVRKAA